MNLTDKIFHDDEAARKHLEAQRWPGGAYCPHCGECEEVAELKGSSTKPGTYICRSCRTKFTVTVGTIFERSHIGLAKWMLAFRLMTASKKGMSAMQLGRMLDITYKSAWFMAHRIREAMTATPEAPLGGQNKVVEVDETYIGGKEANKHANKRTPHSQGGANKQAVVSLVERDGAIRSFHVANVTAKNLRPIITQAASRDSMLMTDQASVYPRIGREFANHGRVNHSAGEYVRHYILHTNSIEGVWALLKRQIIGVHHWISPKHLDKYVQEIAWRFNRRNTETGARLNAILGQVEGRLTYKALIA